MSTFVATCGCGQLTARCTGDPVRISVCHCLECQRRSGSVFAAQARWPTTNVEITGNFNEWTRLADSGSPATFRFCPNCGATVAYVTATLPDAVAIPIGAFADPNFPPPSFSVYEERKHPWVAVLGDSVEHMH